jgi:hypothetical protein
MAYLKVLTPRFIPSLHLTQLFRLMYLHAHAHTHTVRATRVIDLGGAQFVENMAEHCASQFQQLHGIDLRPIARSMVRAASRLLSRLHARASPHFFDSNADSYSACVPTGHGSPVTASPSAH